MGACWPLGPADIITSTHRGHGHCLAKGLDPLAMFAELMGKDRGTNRGRGGSMHIADPKLGIFGANGIVAAGLPIAVGAATASQLRADGGVAVAFFGDGAPAQGAFHEAMNLAAVWQLPVVFFCENNGYAEFSPRRPSTGRHSSAGPPGTAFPTSPSTATMWWRRRPPWRRWSAGSRAGGGPAVVEAATFRWHGHYEGDPERYRSAEEVQEWKDRDPLPAHEARLREAGVGDDELKALESTVAAGLDGAVEEARRLDSPERPRVTEFVLRARPARPEPPPPPSDAPDFRMMDAVHDALEAELADDDRVFVAGIDVGEGGNVFGLMRGLRDRFGDRVRDTPISETADHGPGRRRGHGRHAPGGRADVPRLRRGVLRPAAQPGGQAALHDRRGRRDGADRPHPVRGRPLLGQPALAEPRGAAGPHPRADRGHALDTGRHLRPAARRHPGPQSGGLHREPAALRHEGTASRRPTTCSRSARPPWSVPGSDVTVVSVSRMVHEAVGGRRAGGRRRASPSR